MVLTDGVPTGVERRGVVLAPDAGWERGQGDAGVEDPRVTTIPALGRHVMTYVAYGPLGPRPAGGLGGPRAWRRLGPLHYDYAPALDTDLDLFPTRTRCGSRSRCRARTSGPAYAMLHPPEMSDLAWLHEAGGVRLRPGGRRTTTGQVDLLRPRAQEAERDLSAADAGFSTTPAWSR